MPQFGGKSVKKTSSSSKRHFTVVMGNKEHGLYVSSTPSSAARKAVTKLCAANKSKKVEFYIREITQGSKKKTYGPYEGHIDKLKEPIELKGRVIKYKPVAKLSGKSGSKKGGMRGGTKQIFIGIRPFLSIHTNADIKKIFRGLEPLLLKVLFDMNEEKILYDFTKKMPITSPDEKTLNFIFRTDINDKIIKAFLNDEQKKSEILRILEGLKIPYEVKILLNIPYLLDGKAKFEENLYLVYTPSANLASAAPPYNPENEINYNTLERMKLSHINTLREFNNFTKQYSPQNKEKLRKNYKNYIGQPLLNNTNT